MYTQAPRTSAQHTEYAGYTPQHTRQSTMFDGRGREGNFQNTHEMYTQASRTPVQHTQYAEYTPQHTVHSATPMPLMQHIVKTPQLNLKQENLQQKVHKSTQMPEDFKIKQTSTQTKKRNLRKTTRSTQMTQNCFKLEKSTQTPEKPKQKQVATCTAQMPQNLPEKERPILKKPDTSRGLISQFGTISDNVKKAQVKIEKNASMERKQKALGDKTQHTGETVQLLNEPTYSVNEPGPSEGATKATAFVRPRLVEQRTNNLGNEWEWHSGKILLRRREKQTLNPTQPEERRPKLVYLIKYLMQCTKLPLRRRRSIPHRPEPLYPWQHVSQTIQHSQHTENQTTLMLENAQQPTEEPQPPIKVEKDIPPLVMVGIQEASGVENCNEEDMMTFLMPKASKEVKDTVTLTRMGNGDCKEIVANERQSEHVGNLDKHEENLTGAVMGKQPEPKKEFKTPMRILRKRNGEAAPKEANLKPEETLTRKKSEPMKEPIKRKGILKTPKKVFQTKETVTVYKPRTARKGNI